MLAFIRRDVQHFRATLPQSRKLGLQSSHIVANYLMHLIDIVIMLPDLSFEGGHISRLHEVSLKHVISHLQQLC